MFGVALQHNYGVRKMKVLSLSQDSEAMEKYISKKYGMSLLGFYQAFGRKGKSKTKPKKQNQFDRLLTRANALKV